MGCKRSLLQCDVQDRERSRLSPVAIDVECMLHRLTNLLPSQLGFPYIAAALDFLHAFCTGIATKVIAIVDAIIMTHFQKDSVTRTRDDARGLMDGSLSQVSPFLDLLDPSWRNSPTPTPTTRHTRRRTSLPLPEGLRHEMQRALNSESRTATPTRSQSVFSHT